MADNLISKIIFVILIGIIFVLLTKAAITIMGIVFGPQNDPYIIKGLHEGHVKVTKSQNPKNNNSLMLLRSKNQDSGIEFTYSTWLNIQYLRSYPGYCHIFSKGSNQLLDHKGVYYPNNCPGLYLDISKGQSTNNYNNNNNLVVVMNTYKGENEDIVISNIPLNKWFNVIIRVVNDTVDIYVNGIITKKHKLSGVPKQNYEDVIVCAGKNNGFDGQLSNLRYYNYAINALEINSIANSGPNMKVDNTVGMSAPPYLSTNWYFNNGNN